MKVDEKVCDEKHKNLNENVTEIKRDIGAINNKFDNHLKHIEDKIIKNYKFVFIILAVLIAFVLIPDESKFAAFKAVIKLFLKTGV